MITIKCRIYPTIQQESKLLRTLDTCRWLYNYFLDKNIQSREDMQFILTELKEQEPWLTQFHSKMLQMVLHKIDSSRRALKALQRNGHKIGKLHFIKHDECNTFTYNQSGFKIERHGNTNLLWLSKIGCTEIRLHRPIDGEIKQITITKKAGSWYASLVVEKQWQLPEMINFKKSVGIDVGIRNYAYDSDGCITPNPRHLIKLQKPLIRANRILSRRVYGSQNYKKAKKHYQIMQERIARCRKDFLHKLSTNYSSKYDVIVLEKLQIPNMLRNHHLAQSISDASWGTFKQMIEYKSKIMVEINPRNTTVECSRCGSIIPKTLAIRTHECDQCGLTLDRDNNSANVIHDRGLMLLELPMVHREVTPVEILLGSMKQEKPIALSHG
ncbi:MAG: IS200/IS605 family element transposase accessory protein TnpB [Thaumarchaeota archaeon]|nr:IS200/IS605 family element transposase accessory protein TnpB [Nitrososphaerota archaeon]